MNQRFDSKEQVIAATNNENSVSNTLGSQVIRQNENLSNVIPVCNNLTNMKSSSKYIIGTPDDYDPYNFGNFKNGSSFWGTIFHMYMISAGPALLTMPKNFLAIGYIPAFAIMLVIFFLYWHNMRMIVWTEYELCKMKKMPNMTYPETLVNAFRCGSLFSRWFAPYSRWIIQCLFVVTWIGSFNLVLIATNVQVICETVFHRRISVYTGLIYTFIPTLILTWVHRLKCLIPLSFIGNLISVFSLFFIVYHIVVDPRPLKMNTSVGSISNIAVFLGSVFFNMNATGLMLPLKNEMKEPRRFSSTFGVLTLTYIPVALFYSCFGLFCCLKYGKGIETTSTVLENLDMDRNGLMIMITLYVMSLAFQYPLITYVVFDSLWNNILKKKRESWNNEKVFEYVIRTLIHFVAFGAAYGVPKLDLFLAICGTVGTAIDSYIFPVLINNLVMWKVYGNCWKFRYYLAKNLLILALAVILLVIGVLQGVREIQDYYRGHHE